jgi:hypothetical protein
MHKSQKQDPDPHRSLSLGTMKVQNKQWRALDAHSGGVEVQNKAVEVFRRPMVADSYHFDKEQDPDPNQTEKRDSDPHQNGADSQQPVLTLR